MKRLPTAQISKNLDYALTQMGYEHCLSESRKYWTIVPKGYTKPIRLKNLGEDYTEEAIRRRLMENQRVRIVPFAKQTVVIRQYRLPTKKTKSKKWADCMACICITVTGSVICQNTKTEYSKASLSFERGFIEAG